ncbi:YggT family protein [Amnibacterium setariae]|jgi:YggT family protein|uniref:YggT family protein n=1 Tax=Amnibacterium setariae TaxID=2306585 RepID=A0A3A1TVP6_9MICO|nr:YggT family protein [Amnibacterium setariae]RIX27668.1 YggT family protein [Amnibacterium setariae]
MSPIALVGAVAYVVLLVYFFALWARFILDLVQAFSEGWRPHGVVLVLAEAAYTATDPPIKAVRRVLPPLRIGQFALDFGFTVVMFGVIVLMYLAIAVQGV